MDTKEFIKEKSSEVTDKIVDKLVDKTAYQKADDWFGQHNFFSRLIIVAFIGILIYAFMLPLELPYVEIAAWLTFGTFILISIGINSVKTVGDVIVKIRKKD